MTSTMVEHPTSTRPVAAAVDAWSLVAIGSVAVAITLISVFSPDLVTGSAQEHLPLAALTSWIWGAAAIGYVAFVGSSRANLGFALSVAALWLAVAVTSIAAPEFVTGTDPTRIPLASLIAPVVGTVVTGFICLRAASR